MLLVECHGDEIWSVDTCRQKGIPENWIDDLRETFESGFTSDRQTIYEDGRVTNQYHGVHDLQIAHRLAEYLGVDSKAVTAYALGREAEVRALKEAVEE